MSNKEQILCTFKNTESGGSIVMKIDLELPQSQLIQKINSRVVNELGINNNYHIIKYGILCENEPYLILDSETKFKDLECCVFYIKPI